MPESKRRILCAESNKDVGDLIALMLTRKGYEVESVQTAAECLKRAATDRFDLYMVDDDYIDGTAIQLCKRLRQMTPATPILFFSAQAFRRDRELALEAGATAYLTKPDDLFEIVSTVNSILLGDAPRHRANNGDNP